MFKVVVYIVLKIISPSSYPWLPVNLGKEILEPAQTYRGQNLLNHDPVQGSPGLPYILFFLIDNETRISRCSLQFQRGFSNRLSRACNYIKVVSKS